MKHVPITPDLPEFTTLPRPEQARIYKALRWTYAAIADELEVSTTTVQNWVRPDIAPRRREKRLAWEKTEAGRAARQRYRERKRAQINAMERAYRARPEVKERLRALRQTPEWKARQRLYQQRAYRRRKGQPSEAPEAPAPTPKKFDRAYQNEYHRAYRQRPEVKARTRALQATEAWRVRNREYRRRGRERQKKARENTVEPQ